MNRQHNDFVGEIWRCFEPFRLQALESKAKAVALPIKYFRSITVAIQKNKKDGVKHCDLDLDIQFDKSGQAVNGFSEAHRFGVQIYFFNFSVGPHPDCRHLIEIESTASGFNRRL